MSATGGKSVIGGNGGGGLGAGSFAYAQLDGAVFPSALGTVSTSTTYLFQYLLSNSNTRDITIDTANRRIPVVGGKTYILEAAIRAEGGSANGECKYQWHDGTNFLGTGAMALEIDDSSSASSTTITKFIYTPVSDGFIYLQHLQSTGFSTINSTALGCYASVHEI